MRSKTIDEYKHEVYTVVGDEYIVDGEYITNKTPIKMIHKKCGIEFYATPNNFISKGSRCPLCSGHLIVSGVNDVKTIRPDVYDMLLDKSLGEIYGSRSNVKVDWVCPQCNKIVKAKTFDKVSTYGLMCPHCSDGISYPNKFLHELFNQAINQLDYYESEYSPDWIGRKRYDNYFIINNQQYIVEADGELGHGKNIHIHSKMTLQETIDIDNYKDKMAVMHNIKVIRIDVSRSNMSYIKKSIMNSELSSILDLSDVNWEKCNNRALSSKMMEVINLYNSGCKNLSDIHEIINDISYDSVYKYLLKGANGNLCDYNPNEYTKYRKITPRYRSVICLTNMKIFKSLKDASEYAHLKNEANIVSCCRGTYKTSGKDENGNKLTWMYYDEYLKLQELNQSSFFNCLKQKHK